MVKNLTSTSILISELQADPHAAVEAAETTPVEISSNNHPVAYLISAPAWEEICDILEDIELLRIAQRRLSDGQELWASPN